MLAAMTSTFEIFFIIFLCMFILSLVFLVVKHYSLIVSWYDRNRLQRAKHLGYKHYAANMEYNDLIFSKDDEREAYKKGWKEREKIQKDLNADELGIIIPDFSNKEKNK